MSKLSMAIILFLVCVQSDEMVSWRPSLELEWKDFKAESKPGSDVVAVTASGLSFGFSVQKSDHRLIDYDYEVKAHFYPNKSWYLKQRVTEVVLDHERLHFDITELFARKFRQRIANTKFTLNIDKEMEVIHRTILQELTAFQNEYDTETRHSQNIKTQKEWQTLVTLEIEKLAYYK